MDWVAEERQNRNTRVQWVPSEQRHRRVSISLLPKEWRETNLPEMKLTQVGEGPNIATADHPQFKALATHEHEQGAPGGFVSFHTNPEEDIKGEYKHPRFKDEEQKPAASSSSSGAASSG